MSEELTMDKNKNLRALATPAKGAVEKSKDSPRFYKNGKGRSSYHAKQEGNGKKTVPQKNKGFDKRPRPRSFHCSTFDNDKSQEVNEDDVAEIGSAQNPGSKKTNLNHLLNFKYSSKRDVASGLPGYDRAWRHTKKRTFNKEQFLQANCKFIVKDSGDYTVHRADPDVLVDWSLIEEVCVMGVEKPNCPICLYPTQAAKMTRCGHIYCWPCILHYLALSNKTWRKCPICDEFVKKDDLKSVISQYVQPYNVSDEITMRLMMKQRGSVQAVPVFKDMKYVSDSPPLTKDSVFVKLATLTPQEVVDIIIKREEEELSLLYALEGDCPESCFIQEALQLLAERKKESHYMAVTPDENMAETPQEDNPNPVLEFSSVIQSAANKIAYSNAFENEVLSDDMQQITTSDNLVDNELCLNEKEVEIECVKAEIGAMATAEEPNVLNLNLPGRSGQLPKEYYYFYQASDGQPIYLHSLNVKMLVKEYGSLEACPETITANVVQIEGNTMDENVRKRLRYLNHLPLQCEFLVVELQLSSQHLSKDNLESFLPEIIKRKRQRQKKARDERKREKFIQCEENKKQGFYPSINIDVESQQHFPSYNDSSLLDENEFLSISPESNIELPVSSPSNSTSFAQMLRDGKKKPDFLTKPSESVTKAQGPESEEDNEIAAPDYHQSFCDAIQTALDSIPSAKKDQGESPVGKKKKGKKKLLFSTSMNRSK